MVHNFDERVKIDMQIDDFKNAKGLFGLPTAVSTQNKKAPDYWRDSCGDQCPELKRLVIQLLSCSSSGCERNWSAFEMVHTKKRNHLHQEKLNDLVFVMYNLKLKQKQQKQAYKISQSFDLDDISLDDEWITEHEDPILPNNEDLLNVINRVLHYEGDNFQSQESHHGEGTTCVGLNEGVNLDDLATNVNDDDLDVNVDDEDEDMGIDIDDELDDATGGGNENEDVLDPNYGYDDV